MKSLHARYPFLESAREAVEEASVDLATTVAEEDSPIVERAFGRVQQALEQRGTGEPHRSARVELLSYPVARILVSLVDEPVLTRRYAQAEAVTAHAQFSKEIESDDDGLKSTSTEQVSLEKLLREFDLSADVTPVDAETRDSSMAEAYDVGVGAYLMLASDIWGDEWRLVNRTLADGVVRVTREELYQLIQQAVQVRVSDDLPFTVPDEIGDPLADRVERIEELLADLELTRDIDTVVPDLFPPCMKHLLDQVQKGAHLEHHSRFAITAFLASIGMDTDDIVELYRVNSSFGEDMTRYQTDHIRGETSPTEYSPPSCATMKSYGDCVNMDDLCEKISHPMAYYESRLDDTDDDEVEDWREENVADADA